MSNLVLSIIVIVVIIALLVVYQFLKLHRVATKQSAFEAKGANPELLVELSFDADSIFAKYPAGELLSIKWSELTMIGVRTFGASSTESASVYWGLHAGKSTPAISYPQDAIGDKALLAEFARKLPTFDMQKVMKAVASNSSLVTPIWTKR